MLILHCQLVLMWAMHYQFSTCNPESKEFSLSNNDKEFIVQLLEKRPAADEDLY